MIVSPKYKVAFVAIPKNASKTMREYFYKNDPDFRETDRIHGDFEPDFVPKGYDTFAIVRNPWDRLVSCYEFLLQHRNGRDTYGLDFCEWVERAHVILGGMLSDEKSITKKEQAEWLMPFIDGTPAMASRQKVEHVLTFENLEQEFAEFAELRDMPPEIGVKRHVSKHSHYRTYYDPETADVVKDRFVFDREFYGYEY